MTARFVVIDLETTSREAAEAHIVEWAAVVVAPDWFGEGGGVDHHSSLVRPPIPIPAETSAVHHIIDADVMGAVPWEQESNRLSELLAEPGAIAVAHNAQYERDVLSKTALPSVPWLCTYKAALRIWPDAPGHSNETLRYWLGHGTGRSSRQEPHSALHDAQVTAGILRELWGKASLGDMIKWADEPALLPRCPIGDWRGYVWSDVEESFLYWILKKKGSMRPDVVFCAQTEIDRRETERAAEREARRATAAMVAAADDDIPF